MRRYHGQRLFLALVLFAAVAGCGGPKTFDVTGTVTFNGQPVPAGEIAFDPDPLAGFSGPQGFAFIKDGRFTTAGTGRRVIAGPYVVRVLVCDGKAGPEQPFGKPLRSEYERKEQISAERSTLTIEVPKE
jgi:hypothetical protein